MTSVFLNKLTPSYTSSPHEPLKNVTGYSDPTKIKIITQDLELFWDVYHKMPLRYRATYLESEYIQKGSKGLQAFVEDRIQGGDFLARAILNAPDAYNLTVEARSKTLGQFSDRILESFQRLKELYPQATFADIYFVIGANNSGGTTDDDVGIILGFEVFASDEYYDKIPYLIAHELVHLQQDVTLEKDELANQLTILEYAILEGGADFLGELISGGATHSQETVSYYKKHENDIWDKFIQDYNSKDSKLVESWFYGGTPPLQGAPDFLGYYLGYQICKRYYEKTDNKQLAIRTLLQNANAKQILDIAVKS